MSKVLITGGLGFLGFHLGKALSQSGHQVVLVDNLARGVIDDEAKYLIDSENVTLINTDVVDKDQVVRLDEDFDYIVHLAAIIGVRHVLSRPYDVLEKNIAMMFALLSLAKKQIHLKRFLYASTSEVYAGTLRFFGLKLPTHEETALSLLPVSEARSSYMLSKIYGEALCQHAKIPFTIVRPHNVYGPRMGMSHVIPELLHKAYWAQDGDCIELPSASHQRTFCYVDDAVEMIYRCLMSDKACNKTLNLGSPGPEVTIEEVANLIADVVDRKISFRFIEETPGSPTRRRPDMEAMTAATDYTAATIFRHGICSTFAWYKEYIFDGGMQCAL